MNAAATRRRATALPPERRREELVQATLPLLLEHGTSVTTRQIAEAADVAEGTIFRVFDDKESLIAAVVDAAFDPAPFDHALGRIDPTLPLHERARQAVELLQERIVALGRLMLAVGLTRPPGSKASGLHSPPLTSIEALTLVLEPDADRLRMSPRDAAVRLRSFTLASTLQMLAAEPLSAEEVVDVILNGIQIHGEGLDGTDAAARDEVGSGAIGPTTPGRQARQDSEPC